METEVTIAIILLTPVLLLALPWMSQKGFLPALAANAACLLFYGFCFSIFLYEEDSSAGYLLILNFCLTIVWIVLLRMQIMLGPVLGRGEHETFVREVEEEYPPGTRRDFMRIWRKYSRMSKAHGVVRNRELYGDTHKALKVLLGLICVLWAVTIMYGFYTGWDQPLWDLAD